MSFIPIAPAQLKSELIQRRRILFAVRAVSSHKRNRVPLRAQLLQNLHQSRVRTAAVCVRHHFMHN